MPAHEINPAWAVAALLTPAALAYLQVRMERASRRRRTRRRGVPDPILSATMGQNFATARRRPVAAERSRG